MRHLLLNRVSTPIAPVAITAIAYGVFLTIRLAVHDWDFSFFVTAGDVFTDPASAPPTLTVTPGTSGHDGQFYYRLALDPFTNAVEEHGIQLDLPAYRHQRLLYPLLVHLLSLGQPDGIPFWMVAVNYAGLCLIAWSAACWVRTYGLHPLWGLVFSFYPGFVLTLARDFTEIVAAALLITALWLLRAQKLRAAPTLLTLTVLARETTLLAAAAAALSRWARWNRSRTDALFLIPLMVGLAWQTFLRFNWGHFAAADTGTMGMPLQSFALSLIQKTSFDSGQTVAGFFQMLLVASFAAAAGVAWRESRADFTEKVAWCGYALLAAVVSGNVWSEDWSFLRNLWELYVFSAIILVLSPSRATSPFLVCWGLLWLFEAALRTDVHKLILGGG